MKEEERLKHFLQINKQQGTNMADNKEGLEENSAAQLEKAARRLEQAAEDLKDFHRSIKEDVSEGVQAGVRALASDPAFGEAFWAKGFENLSKHATNSTSQWIGKRLLTALVVAAVTAGITWLVKTGRMP